MKQKTLLKLISLFGFVLVGCASDPKKDEEQDSQNITEVEKFIYISTNESLNLLSSSTCTLKNTYFNEVAPIFEDNHIDHFANAEYQRPLVKDTNNNSFFTTTIQLKSNIDGELYFNINFPVSESIKKGLRIELFTETINKSVIYSFEGGESKTEGYLDLNGDNELDKVGGYPWEEQSDELVLYSTGSPSYNTEKFNENAYLTLNKEEQVNVKFTLYFDIFYSSQSLSMNNLANLNLFFEVR